MAGQPVLVPYPGAGNPVFDALSTTAKSVFTATKAVSCPLYRDFPAFMTGQDIGSPAAAANDSFLNNLCNPTGDLPAPPTPQPFTGGQCAQLYDVVYKAGDAGSSPGNLTLTRVAGPVRGIFKQSSQAIAGTEDVFIIAGSGVAGATWTGKIQVGGTLIAPAVHSIVSVTPSFGGPDVCGNPAPLYPVTSPAGPQLEVNIPVQFSPNFEVTVPVKVFAPIGVFAPSLRVGPFNVDFDLGGLTITPDIDINFPGITPPGRPNPQPPAGQTPGDRAKPCNLDEVLKYLKRIRECQECDRDFDFLQTGFVSGTSGVVTVPSGGIPLTVGMEITQKPSNSKEQPGRGQPNVVYAGWGWFDGNGFLGDRLPVDAMMKLFDAPEKPSPQAFRFTMQAGYEARASMTYKRLKSPLPSV